MSNGRSAFRIWWLGAIGGVVALIIATAAVGIAMTSPPGEIILRLDASDQHFQYGSDYQQISTGKSECSVTDGSLNGPIMNITATTHNNSGRLVTDAPIGLVEDGLGVNLRGKGNGQDCGRIDHLGDGDTETMTLTLGDGIEGQLISSIDFDFEAKFDAEVSIDFLMNGVVIDTQTEALSTTSDDGPDSKFRDKYKVIASTSEGLFDGVTIRMESGSVSLEGGATWEYSEEPVSAHRTVFHLQESVAEVSLDATVNGGDGTTVETGSPLTWSYLVTNTGDQTLTNVSVVDTPLGTASCPATTLASGASTTCTITGNAAAGSNSNSATVTADSEYSGEVEASDGSGYFGSSPGINVNAQTNGPGALPSDDPYIDVGDTVTWTYTVTNTGNVALSSVSVTDDQGVTPTLQSGDTNGNVKLDLTETWVYSASATATKDGYSNIATARGTPPVGADVTAQDGSGYFGSAPGISIMVENNGPVVVTGQNVIWDFTVKNTGNVPLTLVAVEEGGAERCDLGTVAPGATETCQYTEPATGGEQTTSFIAQGSDPLGQVVSQGSGTVSYFGGLACGDGTTAGLPGPADTPLVSFEIGPDNGTKPDPACEVAVALDSTNDGTEQVVSVGPPSGYTWGGVTGIVTIWWDVEPPSPIGVPRTYQRLPGGDVIVPWCLEVVGIAQVPGEWFYDLDPDAVYHGATGSGDTCLILQTTRTTEVAGTMFTQTFEVFYVYNDPIFTRK